LFPFVFTFSHCGRVYFYDTNRYPPTVTGEIPTGRSGHTATVLSSNHLMVVIGGVRANSYQRGVCLLDTNRWTWISPPQIQGDAPRPRSYHTATLVPRPKSSQKEWIVVFGGNDRDTSFNTVHILEVNTATNQWSWIHPVVSGDIPMPRTGHVAVLTDDQTTIVIQGGWDPNSDDDDDAEEESLLDDCYSLDTTTWVWTKLESTSSNISCARVGHRAVYHDDQIHVFGGRLTGHRFSNSWATLKEWNPNSTR
jgi:Galactose oxidase, central domain